jgi:hypothetical protein
MPKAKRKRASKKKPRFTAKTADKHILYQLSVQAPDTEVDFLNSWFTKIRGRKPLSLREDFCGTAILCAAWVKSHRERTATGLDIHRPTLTWGEQHNLAPLTEDQRARVTLLQQDVRAKVKEKHDIICAFNFSYWIFKTRVEMIAYFAHIRSGLSKGGLFFLDAYGGWESHEPMQEHRKIKAGFTYVWDQNTSPTTSPTTFISSSRTAPSCPRPSVTTGASGACRSCKRCSRRQVSPRPTYTGTPART